MGVKFHNSSKAILLPINLGRLYYIHGYEQHKNILLDAIDYVYPDIDKLIQTHAHERIEVILQQFELNTPDHINKKEQDGLILHLVNLTGFSGNTYFNPLPVYNAEFKIQSAFKPRRIFSMVNEKAIDYTWDDGYIHFKVDTLDRFEGIVLER